MNWIDIAAVMLSIWIGLGLIAAIPAAFIWWRIYRRLASKQRNRP